MGFQEIALAHTGRYPRMQAQDYVKLAYQHALGCGHMVKNEEECLARIRAERNGETGVHAESLGNGLIRLHINGGGVRISDEAVSAMFMHTANTFRPDRQALETALNELLSLSENARLSVSREDMSSYLSGYIAAHLPLVSHTQAYKEAYAPAYRVVSEDFEKILPLLAPIEQLKSRDNNIIIAIDGMCASGKTTYASLLSVCLNAPVFHMDDFFLPPEKRTPARLSEPGGNVDYERFYEEVLAPLRSGKPFSYRPFDCSRMALSAPVSAVPGKISIIEGAYALHPTLIDAYDYILVMTVEPSLQKKRILARNGEKMLERFVNEWIPMELKYLNAFGILDKADTVIRS